MKKMRECSDEKHEGDRVLPETSFPKNGKCRRRVCKACWARAHRERYYAAANDPNELPFHVRGVGR